VPAGRLAVVVFVGRKGQLARAPSKGRRHPVGISNWLDLPRARHRQLPDHQQRRHPPPGRILLPARDRHRQRRLPDRLTSRGHFVLGKRTGEVRRNTNIITCRVS